MKQSPLTRKTPIKPSAFKTKPTTFGAVRATGKPRQKAMKSKGPRMTPIRKAARGQDCTIRIPGVCNFDPETTVLCHSPFLESGRGMGLKAPDLSGAFGCNCCHDVLDGRVKRPDWMTPEMLKVGFESAVVRTHEVLKKDGVI